MLYEAPMADYPPIDIDMHHSEPWFDAEAKMEDDIPHFTDHDSASVEVDMDDDYQEIEYEMGDDAGEENYDEMSADLLDIEVHDVSEPPLEDATLPPADAVNPPESHLFGIGPTDSSTASPLPLASPAMTPLPDTDLPDAASEHVEAVAEVLSDEENVGDQCPEPSVDADAPLAPDGNVETNDQLQQFYQSGEEQGETGVPDVPQPEDQHSSFDEERRPESGVTQVPQPEEQPEEHDAAASDSREVDEPVAGDPHEISDGVYIDPPPAVLVSFESSDFPDVCLFNQPARSRSPSPSAEGREQANQVYDLLLHHRPILYYEPLASVFEALRQEEYLAWIPRLADSELVLDAYDLQLVISEDNLYAREVTLHDLNVLHDGSSIAGPLRLRLKSVIPRFIIRYHLLQDQVSRLNLVPAGDGQDPSADSVEQVQEQSDTSQPRNIESQPEEAQNDAPEKLTALEENDDPEEEDQRQEEDPETAPEADPTTRHPENVRENAEENSVDADAAPHETGDGDDYGEKLQPEDGAETVDLPAPPEEDEDEDEEAEHVEEPEEEEESVVETPGPKPIIPLTGAVVEDIGNVLETSGPKTSSDGDPQHESGPSSLQTQNQDQVNDEEDTGVLANDSVDPAAQNDAFDEGESYEEGETQWEDAVEGDEDPDTTWEAEEAENETASNESSVTLSSKASKRSFDKIELEDDEDDGNSPPGSPGAKRPRVDQVA
ncbi:hypothetical protein MSAN_01281500 [Mycena sanguinolenta]|uniref:Uncharacterized protein n=1 Tax=Mycena sanguinolenta TaxID=230812 RepID=A0A8H6YJG4_9AGAR|nr:hypothetical protein MSAN_01281500 [Mycena sanguinolenta]